MSGTRLPTDAEIGVFEAEVAEDLGFFGPEDGFDGGYFDHNDETCPAIDDGGTF